MNKPGREPTRLVPVPSPNIIPERDVDKTPILEADPVKGPLVRKLFLRWFG